MNIKNISNKVLYYPLHVWNKKLFYIAPFFSLPKHPCFIQPVRKNDICLVLANGPSAKEILPDIVRRNSEYDIYTMNFSNESDFFFQLKPRIHVLADPNFFEPDVDQKIREKRNDLALTLRKVNWNLQLAVPRKYLLQAKNIYGSPSISIVNFPCRPISVYKDYYDQLISKGYYDFGAQSVPVPAIYMALMAGYKKILLAGMDADWLLSTRVNEYNQVYFDDRHYYNNGTNIRFSGISYKNELEATLTYFSQLEMLKNYTHAKNIAIINLSQQSIIDLFPKKNFVDIELYNYTSLLKEQSVTDKTSAGSAQEGKIMEIGRAHV